MFQVVYKDHNDLALDFFENLHTVYDVKKDADTNQIMFLLFDDTEGWYYMPAMFYRPLGNDCWTTGYATTWEDE